MFPPFRMCWPLTGHVPRLRPRFHPVFSIPEVLRGRRTRSVELRHVSCFLTFWPFRPRYSQFFAYSHSYPRMSVHMFHYAVFPRLGRSDDRFPTTCPFWPFWPTFYHNLVFWPKFTHVLAMSFIYCHYDNSRKLLPLDMVQSLTSPFIFWMDVFTSYGHILALTRQLLVPTFQTKVHCQDPSNHERD